MGSQSFVVNIADNDALMLEPVLTALRAAQVAVNRALDTRYQTSAPADLMLGFIAADIDRAASTVAHHLTGAV